MKKLIFVLILMVTLIVTACKQNDILKDVSNQTNQIVEKEKEKETDVTEDNDNSPALITPDIVYLDYPNSVDPGESFYIKWKANEANTHRLYLDNIPYKLEAKTEDTLTEEKNFVMRLENNNGQKTYIKFTVYVSYLPVIKPLRFTNNGGIYRALYITVYQADTVLLKNMTTGVEESIHYDVMIMLQVTEPVDYRITATNAHGCAEDYITVY